MSDTGVRAFLHAANENESESLTESAGFLGFLEKIDALFRKIMGGASAILCLGCCS
jgi:hypothetical protein